MVKERVKNTIIPTTTTSIQSLSTPLMETNNLHQNPLSRSYQATDVSPYVIHVQKITAAENDGTTFHPVMFGKFLVKHNFKNIINGSVKRIGRNRIALAFNNYMDANSFVAHESLPKNNMKAFIPSFQITRMGIVKGIPSEWSPDEIKSNVNLPIGSGEIVKIRRLNFKVMIDGTPTWKPSQSVVFTFDGQVLPKRVYVCYNSLPVELYIFPTVQCYNCCRFGHTRLQCRSKPRCYKCGREHTGESCYVKEEDASCCLCNGSHHATSKTCPEYNRQKNIKISMAQNCISYAEASKLHPPISRSFANVTSTPTNLLSHNTHTSLSSSNMSHSYKKTVLIKPRSPPKKDNGYDRVAHNQIINEFQGPSLPNGSALKSQKTNDSIKDIITLLINLLSQTSISPSYVAMILDILNKSFNNGSQSHTTMELPKSD